MESVIFLGHTISIHGISPDPTKVQAILNLAPPKTVKQTQSFLGLANFYRRFIKNFAFIAKPLHDLTKPKTPFVWTDTHQKAFEELKSLLSTSPIRHYPNTMDPFLLFTDASSTALGAILCQKINGSTQVINYNSRLVNQQESKYSATELECLAILWGILINRQYLALAKFTVVTDHMALQWLKNNTNLNSRLLRWSLKLQDFDFDIKYQPGEKNIADYCHGGLYATLHLVDPIYHSQKFQKMATNIIKSCKICQTFNLKSFKSPLIPVFSAGPFYRLQIDTVGPLPKTQCGNKFILAANTTEWDLYLAQATFAANICKNRTSKFSPSELLYGRTPSLPSQLLEPSYIDRTDAQDIELHRQIRLQSQLSEILPKAKIGDKVLVKIQNPADKLKPKWQDGFTIDAIRCNSFLVNNGSFARVVHARNVKIVEDADHSERGEVVVPS